MATVGEVDRAGKELWVFAKGAPEVMRDKYAASALPANYDDVYKYYMRMGRRFNLPSLSPITLSILLPSPTLPPPPPASPRPHLPLMSPSLPLY